MLNCLQKRKQRELNIYMYNFKICKNRSILGMVMIDNLLSRSSFHIYIFTESMCVRERERERERAREGDE